MISRASFISIYIAIVASLLSEISDGFSNVAHLKREWGQRQLEHRCGLAKSAVDDLDMAATELLSQNNRGRGTAVGKNNANEVKISKQSVGIESEFPKRKIKASVRETGTDSMKYYIKSMCNHELLNKNEEIILAREIQILLKWEAQREKLEEELLR